MKIAPEPLRVESSQGSYLYLKSGAKILDGISSWWVITHGHNHPYLSEAIARQCRKLDQVVFANFSHEPAERLTELLGEVLPESLSHLFFSDNGSTAVEVAIKMVYQYWSQSGLPQKKRFLIFEHGYHGDTCGAMSVSGTTAFSKAYGDLQFDVICCEQGGTEEEGGKLWIENFRKKMDHHRGEIAAILIEPLVQGAGGMIFTPPKLLKAICDLARQEKILVIFDEVMTGLGRTGSLFAFEQVGFVPDILCLSKGLTGGLLPLSLTAATQEIYNAFYSDDVDRMLFHGHSFTGNPISCAAAVASLEIFKREPVLERVLEIERAHRRSLSDFAMMEGVRSTRSLGAIGVVELKADLPYGATFQQELSRSALNHGLFLRPLGSTIYLLPPYCTTPAEVASAWKIIASFL